MAIATHTDNRGLRETDLKVNKDLSHHPDDTGVDPIQLFANACSNHSETLCGTLVRMLMVHDPSISTIDSHAIMEIRLALRMEL